MERPVSCYRIKNRFGSTGMNNNFLVAIAMTLLGTCQVDSGIWISAVKIIRDIVVFGVVVVRCVVVMWDDDGCW